MRHPWKIWFRIINEVYAGESWRPAVSLPEFPFALTLTIPAGYPQRRLARLASQTPLCSR